MSKKFILGTLFGATVGAGLALLFAPKKGEDLREELLDKSQDLKAVALDYVELMTIKGEELKQTALESSEQLRATLNDSVSDLKQQFAEKHENLKSQFAQLKDGNKVENQELVEEVSDVVGSVKKNIEQVTDELVEQA